MKVIMMSILSLLVLACWRQKDEVFSLEEANACLLESDKSAVREAVRWIKKAEATKDEKKSAEYFGKAYDPVNELYGTSRENDSMEGRKRSAALAWVLIDLSYNHATGSCANGCCSPSGWACWRRIRLWPILQRSCADIFCRQSGSKIEGLREYA